MSITFTDGVTPLNAANMNALLQRDNVVAAAARLVANKLFAADAQPVFQARGDGQMQWGPGGSTAPDTILQRLVAGIVNTPNAFSTGAAQATTGSTAVGAGTFQGPGGTFASVRSVFGYAFTAATLGDPGTYRMSVDSTGKLQWGDGTIATADTTLYRFAPQQLITDGSLVAGGSGTIGFIFFPATVSGNAFMTLVRGEGNYRFIIDVNGRQYWGPGGATSWDTSLYRSAAGILKTDQNFRAGLDLYAQDGGATQVRIGNNSGRATIDFGSAMDANLYRSAAGWLTTDGSLVVTAKSGYNPGLRIIGTGYEHAFQIFKASADPQPVIIVDNVGQFYWGPGGSTGPDTYLYRSGVGALQTSGSFIAQASIFSNASSAGGAGFVANGLAASGYALLGKQSADTQYRFGVDANGRLLWGPGGSTATETNLYRAAPGVVKTDGAIATTSYGTTLPASPVDGQEYTLVDSVTNPQYAWRFRYNAGHSGDAYKWEFIGGPQVTAYEATETGMNISTLGPYGPVLVPPRAGYYTVRHVGFTYNSTAATSYIAGQWVTNPGVTPLAGSALLSITLPGVSTVQNFVHECTVLVPTGGIQICIGLYGSVANCFTRQRTHSIIPVRVS